MGVYTNDVTRVTGLSGIDTDSMVEKLMKAESAKYNKLTQKKQKTEWKQTAYRDYITKLQSFQDKYFGTSASKTNFRYSKAFQNFSTTVMNKTTDEESKAITVNSTTNAGTYKVQVSQLASADKYTSDSTNVTEKSIESTFSLAELKSTIEGLGDGENLSFKLTYDGTAKEISLSKSDFADLENATTDDLKSVLDEKLSVFGKGKVAVSEEDGVFSFKASENGHSLTIAEGTSSKTGTSSLLSLDKLTDGKLASDIKGAFKVTIDGVDYTVKVDLKEGDTSKSIATKMNSALAKATKETANDDGTTSATTSSIAGKLNFSIEGGSLKMTNKSSTEDISVQGLAIAAEPAAGTGDGTDEGVPAPATTNGYVNIFSALSASASTADAVPLKHTGSLVDMGFKTGTTTVIDKKTDTLGDVLSGLFESGSDSATVNINNKSIVLEKSDTIASFLGKMNASGTGVTVEYNSIKGNFTMTSNKKGEVNNIKIGDDVETAKFMDTLFNSHEEGQDAKVKIDGEEITYTTNDIDVNGLKMTLNKVTGDDVLEIKSVDSVDETYNLVKGFVDDYNALVKDIYNATRQTRTKSGSYTYYEPLTDEQRKAMEDTEIERWETEAKKGMFYNDDILGGLLSKMRGVMYSSVNTENGTKMALYSIGITTSSNYSAGGLLEIDEDKLREAIKNKGNEIRELFTQSKTGLADQMKSALDSYIGNKGSLRQRAGITGTSSVNENTLSQELKSISGKMETEKLRLYDKENQYYKMFSAMEASVTKNNSQMDQLYSLLGQ